MFMSIFEELTLGHYLKSRHVYVYFPGKGGGLGFSLSGLLRIVKGRGVGAMGPADFFPRKNAVEVDLSLQKCG